jgi:hypothetical protein
MDMKARVREMQSINGNINFVAHADKVEGGLRLGPKSCIPHNVVSFHYVSQKESLLLFQYLNKQNNSSNIPSSPGALAQIWPNTNSEVGHYSRPIKSQAEAQILYNTIFNTMRVSSC